MVVLAPRLCTLDGSARPPMDTSGIYKSPIFFFEKNENFLKFSDLAGKLIRKTFWKFYPPQIFFGKKRKFLKILWFGEKVDQKNPLTIFSHPPPRHVCRKISASADGGPRSLFGWLDCGNIHFLFNDRPSFLFAQINLAMQLLLICFLHLIFIE